MHATTINTLPIPTIARSAPAVWRNHLAAWLIALAKRLGDSVPVATSAATSNVAVPAPATQRSDVLEWFANLSPATRTAVCPQPWQAQALVRVASLLKYLPDELTLLDFVRRVPDWQQLHKRFSAYLLRRLGALRHHGRDADMTFELVHAWLQRRNRCLTAVPMQWYSAVSAARSGVGEDAAEFLVHDNRGPAFAEARNGAHI